MSNNGITPDIAFHNNMIQCCKYEIGEQALVDSDMRHIPLKSRVTRLLPDIVHTGIAIECQTIPKYSLSKLYKYKMNFKHLIFCLPTPNIVSEIWIYDVESKTIKHKINNSEEQPIIQLSLSPKQMKV